VTIPSVCHIITKLELGGAQRNTLFTVSHLDKSRFRTFLITGEAGILDEEAHVLMGNALFHVPRLGRHIRPLKDALAFISLVRLLRQIKPTIVHTHSSKAGIIGRLAAWAAGVPVVVHSIHGFGFTRYQHPFRRLLLIGAERLAARVTTRFFAVSEANRSEGVARRLFTGNNCTVIRSGIDIEAIRKTAVNTDVKKRELGFDPAQPLIGMVAPMKPQKAPLDFIRAAALVRASHPNLGIVLVGDGELRPAVEAEIDCQGLREHVKLLGWRHDVPEILRCLDVFILTSLWEGLPRVYLEALTAGVPIVGTRVDGADEVIKDGANGYLVEPRDVIGVAKRVQRLLDDRDLRVAMGRRAAAGLPVEFDIYEMVRRLESEYDRLIAGVGGLITSGRADQTHGIIHHQKSDISTMERNYDEYSTA
jgi:glycosyltransferase involved in cell wall biosynthesis